MDSVVRFIDPTVSNEVSRALSWGGLQNTTNWQQLADTNTIKNINVAGRIGDTTNFKMKKCNDTNVGVE